MTHRIESLSYELAGLVDRVPDPDIDACVYLLTISAMTATGLGDDPDLTRALTALREHGRVSGSTRLEMATAVTQAEHRAFAAARRGDEPARDRAFFQARALSCLAYAIGATTGGASLDRRDVVREVAYEATVALRGESGVVGVVTQYAG
ncbi:hypothetical protein [Gordonia soli]|uniref:Uncharacterized protein n=1 Tax=Gordonia soli NBRC 108243 TaxID=1223545 RepID=M0QKB7_9ACTN|nr:hypothetical protein [Gordonia soli]GAC69003.1 hypothetical protein GS4_20_00680 [Gordonia soli NBRC 108243]